MISKAKAAAAEYLINRQRADCYRPGVFKNRLGIAVNYKARLHVIALLGEPDETRDMPNVSQTAKRRPMILVYRIGRKQCPPNRT